VVYVLDVRRLFVKETPRGGGSGGAEGGTRDDAAFLSAEDEALLPLSAEAALWRPAAESLLSFCASLMLLLLSFVAGSPPPGGGDGDSEETVGDVDGVE
jgi:hypothetical protein